MSAAGGARASARRTAGALSMRFGERRGLPEARSARRVGLILKSLVAPFQPIPLVLGACQGVAQLRDLLLLSSSVSGGDPPALPGRHPEFDNSGSGMRNSRS